MNVALPRDFAPQTLPVRRPSVVSTYAPSYTPSFGSVYSPAAIVTLSEAARARLRVERAR
jgi:hypothetical protein